MHWKVRVTMNNSVRNFSAMNQGHCRNAGEKHGKASEKSHRIITNNFLIFCMTFSLHLLYLVLWSKSFVIFSSNDGLPILRNSIKDGLVLWCTGLIIVLSIIYNTTLTRRVGITKSKNYLGTTNNTESSHCYWGWLQ